MMYDNSFISNADCIDIEYKIKEWIDEIKNNPDKNIEIQHRIGGAISILNKIDNISLDIKRDKHNNVQDIHIKIIESRD